MANVIELLQKLISHEQSARAIGNTAEADAFAGKIQKLLCDNNLSMADVMAAPQVIYMEAAPQVVYREYSPPASRTRRKPRWHDDPPTEKQIRTIEKLYKCAAPPTLTKWTACCLIESFFDR